jgi:chemotaxis protein histidine kinase CheA
MTQSDRRFAVLRAGYAESLATKRGALVEAWRAFEARPDEDTARALQVLVHRLAGSAPAYGYEPLGTAAAVVDAVLLERDRMPPDARASAALVAQAIEAPMAVLIERLALVADSAPSDPSR